MGAVPGRGKIKHAELAPGPRVVHGGRPAHPAVNAAGEMLRGVHGGRMVQPERQIQGVRPDAGFVPPASRDEVHFLRLAPHDRAAVCPQDAGGGIGDRHDQLTVVRSRLQLGFELPDGGAERARLPGQLRFVDVSERCLVNLGHDVCGRALPARDDLGSHARALCARRPLVTDRWNVQIPRSRQERASPVQLSASRHDQPQGCRGFARYRSASMRHYGPAAGCEVKAKSPKHVALRSFRHRSRLSRHPATARRMSGTCRWSPASRAKGPYMAGR
jgi:hypothetical protein